MGEQLAQRTSAPTQTVPANPITTADRILQELRDQSQRGLERGPQARQAIESAELAMAAANRLAQSFARPQSEGGLGVQARQGATMEQRRQESLTRLTTARERLVELRGHTFGDEVIDAKFRRSVDLQIGVIDTALTHIRGQGGRAVTNDDIEQANTGMNQVRGTMGRIVEVATAVTGTMRAGLGVVIARHTANALELSERGETARAGLLISAANGAVQRKDVFTSQDGSGQLGALQRVTGQLADLRTRMSEADLARLRGDVTSIMAGADEIAARRNQAASMAFESQNRMLRSVLASETNERMRTQLRDIIADNEALIVRLQRGSANPPSQQELRIHSARTLAVRSMSEELARTPAALQDQTSMVFSAALRVLDTPPTTQENADALMARFSTLTVAGASLRNYTSTRGAEGREHAQRRSAIARETQAIADAQTPQERIAAERQLTTTLATYASRDLAAATGGLSGDMLSAANAIAAPLAQPGTATITQVQAAMQAVAAIRQFNDAVSPAHRMDQPTRDGITTIYARALGALAQPGGIEAFGTQLALAGRYADSPATRPEIARVSERAAQSAEGMQLAQRYLEADRQVAVFQNQRARMPAGSEAARALDIIITGLQDYRTKIANGQDLASEAQITSWTERIRRDMGSDQRIAAQVLERTERILAAAQPRTQEPTREQVEAAQAQAVSEMGREMANAMEQDRISTLMQTGEQMLQALQTPGLAGSLKADIGRLFRMAVGAISSGNTDDGTTYRDAAMAYLALRGSRNARERADIMQICRAAEEASPQAGAGRFSQTQLQVLQVYRQMGEYESKITDQRTLLNSRAFFDLALIAARGNDPRQFQIILDMANLYAGMASIPENTLTPQLREQRDQAMAFVTTQLGDYRNNRSMRGGSRLLDLESGGRGSWRLARGVTLPPIARALVSTNAPASEEHPHLSVADALGNGNASAGVTRFQEITGQLNGHMQNLDDAQFEQRARAAEGNAATQRNYTRAGTRLREREAAALRAGDTILARYYHDQAELVDPQAAQGYVQTAREIRRRSAQERDLAARLGTDAANVSSPDAARERQNAEALIALLPEDQRPEFTRRLTEAGTDAGRVRAVYTDVLAAQLPQQDRNQLAQLRTRIGTLDLERARAASTQLIGALPQAYQAGFTERLQRAGENVETVRGVIRDILHLQLVAGEAQVHAGRSVELRTQASTVLDGVSTLNRSAGLDTRRAESGRQELVTGIRTTIALSNGWATDLLGNTLMEDQPGEGGTTRRVPVRANAQATQLQQEQARSSLATGMRLVALQEQIRDTRNRGLASARAQIRDNNIEQSIALVERMIAMLPENRKGEFQEILRQVRTREEGESESHFRNRQASLLQSTYSRLGDLTGTRTTDDEGRLIYDTVGNYNDYRVVSGLFYAERFDVASSSLNRAVSTIGIQSGRAGNWVTNRVFQIQRQAIAQRTGFPPGLGRVASALASPEGLGMAGGSNTPQLTDATITEIISHLPPDRRAVYEARLARIRQQESALPQAQRGSVEAITRDIFMEGGGRGGLLEALASERVTTTGGRSVNLLETLASNTPLYYDAQSYDRRFVAAQAAVDRGNTDEAGRIMLGLVGGRRRDGSEVVGDIERGQGMETNDQNRFRLRASAWEQATARGGVRSEYIQGAPPGEEQASSRQTRLDRNQAIEPVLTALEGSMQRSVDELNAAANASERARDEIRTGGGVLRISPEFVASMVVQLPEAEQRAYDARINEMVSGRTTPSRRSEIAREIYAEMQSNPEQFRSARDSLLLHTSGQMYQYQAQLEADYQTGFAESRHRQRTVSWTYARLNLSSMQGNLGLGDQAEISRPVRSDYTRHARTELDRVKGRPGQMYTASEAHREHAARRAEAALAMLDEHNDYRGRDILRNNETLTAPTYVFNGARGRNWNYARTSVYVTVLSDRSGSGRRIGGRQISPIDELDALNRAETRELASYTDKDLFYGSRERIRPHLDTVAQNQTDIQLALLGLRRVPITGDPDGYTHRIVTWEPANQQEYERVNEAYTHFMRLRGQMENSIFQHDSPWGDDPQLQFLARTAERTALAWNAVEAIQPYPYGPPDLSRGARDRAMARSDGFMRDSRPFYEESRGQYRDSDYTTTQAQSSMTNYRSGYNVACGVGEFVVATAGVVFSPMTGGASLALTVGVGALGVHRGFEMARQADEWTGMAYFSVAMGAVGMVLPVAGYVAGGGRFLASGAQLAGEMSTASEGLATAASATTRLSRIASIGQRSSTLERLVGTAESANWAQRYIGRTIIGATELNLAQRGVHLMGTGMMVGGFAQFGYQLPEMIHGVQRGDMAWFEAAFGGFQAIVQPLAQAGHAQYMVGRAARGGGIPPYRSAFRQAFEATFLGHPLTVGREHALSLSYHNAQREFNSLPPTARESYAAYRDRSGFRLPPDIEARVLRQYNEANSQGARVNFEDFAAGSRDVRIARLEAAREAIVEGRASMSQFRPDEQAYIRTRQQGGSETQAFVEMDTYHATQQRRPAPPTPDQVAEQGRQTLARLDRAAEMRDRRDAAAAATALRQERSDTGAELRSRFTGSSSDGQTTTYTLGRGENAIRFSEPHVNLAEDMVFNAQRIVRRPEGQTMDRAVAEARTRIRAQLEPEVRANRMTAADADRITGERVNRIEQMARDPEFVRATPRTGEPQRSEQLRLGLESAGFLPEIAARPDVIMARNATEVLRITSSRELTPSDIDVFAHRRMQQADEAGARADGMQARAARLRESNPQSQEATALDASAQRLRTEAAGLERSADILYAEAAGRRSAVRANDLRARADHLDYRALLDQAHAGDLRSRAAGMRTQADRISPRQEQRGARSRAPEPDVPQDLANVSPERYAASALRNRAMDFEQAASRVEAEARSRPPDQREAARMRAEGYRQAASIARVQAEQFESGAGRISPESVRSMRRRAGSLRTEANELRTQRDAEIQRAELLERSGRTREAHAARGRVEILGRSIAAKTNEARFLTMEAGNLETILQARAAATPRAATAQTAIPRQGDAARASSLEYIFSDDAVGRRIIERAQAPRDQPGRRQEWFVSGERETVGETSETVTTQRVMQSVDRWLRGMARAGEERDIIVLSGDKRLLNNINGALGMEIGDRALSAYRAVLSRAVNAAAGEGTPFMIRPSSSGDEVLAVIVVPRGRGQAVREALAAGVRRAEAEVLAERMNPAHPESLAPASRLVRDPRGLVSASVEIGDVVQIRRGQGGEVTATAVREDGSTYNAEIARTDSRGGQTREVVGPALSRADDPRWGRSLRSRLGVEGTMDKTLALEPLEVARVREALARQRSGQPPRSGDEQVIAEVRRRMGPDVSEDAAVFAVANARANVSPTERVSGEVFEVRMEVTDPRTLAAMRALLPESNKGLAELLTNRFGIRGLNTFLGHPGANGVITSVERAVGDFAASAYARQRGIRVRRLGTMKYVLEGGNAADMRMMRRMIDRQLRTDGIGMRMSRRTHHAQLTDVTGEQALAHAQNGHLTVDRRRDPARRTDWDGEARLYEMANTILSKISLNDDAALARALGPEGFALLRNSGVLDVVRGMGGYERYARGSIRNFEDFILAVRREVGGERGAAMESAFRQFIIENEQVLTRRFQTERTELSPADVSTRIAAERTRAGGIYARREGTLTDQEQAVVARVNELVSSRGMTPERALDYVADENVRPHAVNPEEARHPTERSFRGMPSEFQNTRVLQGDGSVVRLGDVQRGRLIGRLDDTAGSSGSSAGVFRGEVLVNGEPREVAIKLYQNPFTRAGQQLTPQRWRKMISYAQGEVNNLRKLSELRVSLPDGQGNMREVPLGPAVIGFVQVDGNPAVAMERVQGRAIDELTPSEIRRYVTPRTYEQVRVMWEAITRAGYEMGDFQFAVLTSDQRINGVQRQAGEIVIWDAGSLARRGRSTPPVSAEYRVNDAQRTEELALASDYFWQGGQHGEVVPRRPAAEYTDLDTVLRGALRLPPNHQASTAELLGNFRDMGTTGPGHTEEGLSRAQRVQRVFEYLAGLPDRALAARLEATLRTIEEGSGLQFLPERAQSAQEQARARTATAGAPARRDESSPGAPRGPRLVEPPAREPTPLELDRTSPSQREPAQPPRQPSQPPREQSQGPRGQPQAPREPQSQVPREPTPMERANTEPSPPQMRAPSGPGEQPQLRDMGGESPVPRQALDDIRAGMALPDVISRLSQNNNAAARRLETAVGPLIRDPIMSERFRLASDSEKAMIVDSLARGRNPADAFMDLAAASAPRNAQEFESLASRLAAMPVSERNLRLTEIRASNSLLADAMNIAANAATPQARARLGIEFEAAIAERARIADIARARSERTPDELRAQEQALVQRAALDRGLNPEAMTRRYGSGGHEGRLNAIEGLGIDVAGFRSTFQREQQRISAMAEGPLRQAAQRSLDHSTEELFSLVTRGGLQQRIGSIRGYEGATITGIDFIPGMRGVFEVRLSNNRRVYIKMEDVSAARFGNRLAATRGLVTSEIHAGFSYETGLTYRNGTPVRQEFGIIEDIRGLAGRDISIRLPGGVRENVRVVGVSMLLGEVLNVPRPPAADATPAEVQAYQQRLSRMSADPVAREFFRLSSTPGGRETLMQAWNAYHEYSRRSLLGDRYARNTAAVLVQRGNGEQVLTFQPIDMDAVGWRILANNDGTPNFMFFNRDFADASTDFIQRASRATLDARGTALTQTAVPMFEFGQAMFSPRAQRPLPPEVPTSRQAGRDAINSYDGQPFGTGYDTTTGMYEPVGGMNLLGGRARVIERADGRSRMYADELTAVMDANLTPQARAEYAQEQQERTRGVRRRPGGGGGPPPAQPQARQPSAPAIEITDGQIIREPSAPARRDSSAPHIEIVEGPSQPRPPSRQPSAPPQEQAGQPPRRTPPPPPPSEREGPPSDRTTPTPPPSNMPREPSQRGPPRPSERAQPDRTMQVSDSDLIPGSQPPRRATPAPPPPSEQQRPSSQRQAPPSEPPMQVSESDLLPGSQPPRRATPPPPSEQAQAPARRSQPPPPPSARTGRTSQLTEADLIPVQQPQRPVPPPLPPAARQRGAAQAQQPPVTPADLTQPNNLSAFANRLAANDPAALRDLAAMPQQVRDTLSTLMLRAQAHAGNPTELAVILREFSGRVFATRLMENPETLWRFASTFRFGVDATGVLPSQRAMLDSLPPSIRDLVVNFGLRLRNEWSARDALAPSFAERLGRLIDVETVRDLHMSHQDGIAISNPIDRLTIEYLTAGGRTVNPATRTGSMALEAAARMRSAAIRLAETSGGATDMIAVSRANAERVRTGTRPADFRAALSYDLIRDLAQESAAAAGRGTPAPEDYVYATMAQAYFARGASTDTVRVVDTHHASGNEAVEQHATARIEWGGQRFELRIFRDRINVGEVDALSAIGEPTWPSIQMRDAFARYAQRMLRGPLEDALRPVMRAIPRQANSNPRSWDAARSAFPADDIAIGRQARAPPAQEPMTPEQIVRAHNTADVASRADAASAYAAMSPRDRARTIELIRERARPLEERAGGMESEARRLEAQNAQQAGDLTRRQQASDAEATRLFEQGRQITEQARAAEARGDTAEGARLRAEANRIEGQAGVHDQESRRLQMELGRLQEPANTLRNSAAELRLQARYWNEHAMSYRELGSLSGEAGASLSRMFGVPQAELASIYSRAPTLSEARQAIYDRLGIRLADLPDASIRSDAYKSFNTLADDPYLAGMIFTGDLFRNIEQVVRPDMLGLAPGDRVVVRGVSFQNGLVGAYRIKVEVVDSQGRPRQFTDRGGQTRSSMNVFAKRQDLRPDAVGSEGGTLTGAPSPTVRVTGDNGNLSYVSPEGHTINYGIMRDIHDFHGPIDAGGHRVQVTVDAAEDLYGLVFQQQGARETQRQQLFNEIRDNPDQFIEALGYAQTGFAAAGFYDRHEGNVWAMWLRIGNQPPAEAARIANSLRGQGYRVRDNGDGSFSFLRFGAIDSDTFGSYRARVRDNDTISLRPMSEQLTTDLHRVFIHLTYELNTAKRQLNTAETQLAASQGRAPRLLTVEQVVEWAFGQNMDGPWIRGMRRWATEFNPTTEQGRRFNEAMRGLLGRYHGQRSGMGFAMEGAQLGRFERDGYMPVPSALNGSPVTLVDGMDGRASFMATGRLTANPTIGESSNRRITAAIPEGQDRYLIRTDNLHRSQRTMLRGALGAGAQEFRTAIIGGRTYLSVSDASLIPRSFLGQTVVVRRTGNVLYTYNHGTFMTQFPEGRRVHMLRLDGLRPAQARALSRIPGARTLELGITGERRYLIIENRDAIPTQFRDRAVEVVRYGNNLMGADGMDSNLGILHTRGIGAVRMFDHMMGMGDSGWTGMWRGVRDGILAAEGNERARPDQNFLVRRVPQPGAQHMLPPEYGGPPRTQPLPPDANPPGGPPPAMPPRGPPPLPNQPGGGTLRGVAPPADAPGQPAPSQPPPPSQVPPSLQPTPRIPSAPAPNQAIPSDARATAVRPPGPLPSQAQPTTVRQPPGPLPSDALPTAQRGQAQPPPPSRGPQPSPVLGPTTRRGQASVPPQAIPTDLRPTPLQAPPDSLVSPPSQARPPSPLPSPPQQQGQPPASAQQNTASAQALVRGDADAVVRYRGAQPAQRDAIGMEVTRQLGLAEPDRLASFARDIIREDPQALRRREYLPAPVRRAVDGLVAVRRLRNNAGIDASFNAFLGTESAPGPGRARVVEASQAVGRALAEPPSGTQRETVPEAVRLAGSLNLNEAEGVSNFVRRLAEGNETAQAQLQQLPREIRGQLEAFIRNPQFRTDQSKLEGAAMRIGRAMENLEVASIQVPEITPGSTLDRIARESNLRPEQMARVEFHNRRLGEVEMDGPRILVRDGRDPNILYMAVDSDRGMYWTVQDTRFPEREPRTIPQNGNAEMIAVLRDRYRGYAEAVYTRQVDAEFRAQTRYTDIASFRAHLESTVPANMLANFETLRSAPDMEGFMRGLTAAMTANPGTRLSMAQVQLLINRYSQRLGLATVDVSAMSVNAGQERVPLTELAQTVYLAAEGMVAAHGSRQRVYLWRDAGGFMGVDAMLSADRGGPQPRGALINRVAFGQGAGQRQPGQRVDPAAALRLFDATVRDTVEAARASVATPPGQADRYGIFMSNLRERVARMRGENPEFNRACNELLEYMTRTGIINPQATIVFDGVLIDSGSRTLLPFMQALLENTYGSRVHVDIMYFNVAPGFEFLPNLGMNPRIYDAVESAGANNTFILNNQDYNSIEMHGQRRTRDSLAYFLLLRAQGQGRAE